MINRWTILVALFLARTAMAFQYQAIAALSPILADVRGLELAQIGLLIGLYLAPGLLVAVPGSAMAQRFGEKRIVLAALGLMLFGSLLNFVSQSYEVMIMARILAGIGGVVVNIVMTKLLVDWFQGREIATALAIFVNSWPFGIALAAYILPQAAIVGGLQMAEWAVVIVILIGLAAFGAVYQSPPGLEPTPTKLTIAKLPYWPLCLAGLVWALYNTALAMVFGFGALLFTERGYSVAEAGTAVSAFMLVFSLALPIGGILADKTGRRDLIISVSLLSFAILMPLATELEASALFVVLLLIAALFSIAAGPVMTLPSVVLPPPIRTFGMGVFFMVYYLVMTIAPRLAGSMADASGQVETVFWLAAVLSLAAQGCLVLFRTATRVA